MSAGGIYTGPGGNRFYGDGRPVQEFMRKPFNTDNKSIGILHGHLQRVGNSRWQSHCPVCRDGLLLVKRDQGATNKLLAEDNCIACGQRFIYTDIEELRQEDASSPQKAPVETGPKEADMTISGTKLSTAQSMTVRVAIQTFGIHCMGALKDDPTGNNLYKGYMARIHDLNELIRQTAR